ncbi:uncharacterized protein ASCRUDRAFT_75233 [Ascoidea rubescens DSM 1968]|uniref:Uncharacterized protein n=1 Tax=Ascoidea rubescens DSM 1968 TaxID=1344418 RepID=A0A1D2VK55_9ASCO|nr:hypothetical protein ASCRUDRAFT_75233 [Ascoidea rubescens DSM 1968]ODV62002.1 hypothetical protein ASCRUDRAFT_75233 [Ascoidea rubescens DSM 1968]
MLLLRQITASFLVSRSLPLVRLSVLTSKASPIFFNFSVKRYQSSNSITNKNKNINKNTSKNTSKKTSKNTNKGTAGSDKKKNAYSDKDHAGKNDGSSKSANENDHVPKDLANLKNSQFSQLSKEQQASLKKEYTIRKEIFTQQIRDHLPGETIQSNALKDRLPSSFNLKKDVIPNLLPRPGVPQPSSTMTLTKMFNILKSRNKPELIYESESHRLYFLIRLCVIFVFTFYAITFIKTSSEVAYEIFLQNNDKLSPSENLFYFGLKCLTNIVIFSVPLALIFLATVLPNLLVRRIYYIPSSLSINPKISSKKVSNDLLSNELIKITSHPLIPGRPTPTYTIPLNDLTRSRKARIFTNKGFYGVLDKSSFLFFIFDKNRKLPWIVDRNGFFWGDGRIFDILFGKESIKEAEAAISWEDRYAAMNEKIESNKLKLKEKHGFLWRTKESFNLFKQDVKSIPSLLSPNKNKIQAKIEKKPQNKIEDINQNQNQSQNQKSISEPQQSIIDTVYNITSHKDTHSQTTLSQLLENNTPKINKKTKNTNKKQNKQKK